MPSTHFTLRAKNIYNSFCPRRNLFGKSQGSSDAVRRRSAAKSGETGQNGSRAANRTTRSGTTAGGRRIFTSVAAANKFAWGRSPEVTHGITLFPAWKNTGRRKRSAVVGTWSIRAKNLCALPRSTVIFTKNNSRKSRQKHTSEDVESYFIREIPIITAFNLTGSSRSGRRKFAGEQESATGRAIPCTAASERVFS